jgi:orotate phosphoribosyltransferase
MHRSLDPDLQALVELLKLYSIRRGTFRLKSGKASNWFIDVKRTICRPEGMVLVANAVLQALPDNVMALGGLTMGADPVAFGVTGFGVHRGRLLRSFSIRREAKAHGARDRIAGALEPGDRVAITEDVVTRGVSMFEAVDVVRRAGAEPVLLVPIVDRGSLCADRAAREGLAFQPLLTAPDLGFPYERDVL